MKERKTIAELEEIISQSDSVVARQKALSEMVSQMVAARKHVAIALPTEKRLRFGIIGDTHIGSGWERIDALEDYYANAAARKISLILHAGDVLAGHGVYRGQEFEVHKHGWEQQRAHFVESMPRIKGIATKFITGNHDASFTKLTGLDVGPALCERRPDFECVGADIGAVTLTTADGHEFRVQLLHPDGGTAYAVSYRPQKLVDALAGGMEVENPRLATSARTGELEGDEPDHVEFLDDRVVLFCSAGQEPSTFRYALRVIAAGTFALPPIQASCMYDEAVACLGKPGRVTVHAR